MYEPFRFQVNAMNASVDRSLRSGDYGSALALAQSALEMARRHLASNDLLLGTALNNFALVSQKLGLNDQAATALDELREVDRVTVGEDSLEHSTTLEILASLYRDTERLDEALPVMERVVEIRRRAAAAQPAASSYLAIAADNLGDMYRLAKRLDDAERLITEAIDIFRRIGDRAALGIAYNNLAMVKQDTGDLEGAVALLEQAREFKRAELGPSHPDYLGTIGNLADLYEQLDRRLEATELAREAADADDIVSEQERTRRWRRAARLCRLTGAYGEAETYLRRLLAVLQSEHEATASGRAALAGVYNELGILYGDMDNLAMAEQMLERAAELLRSP